MKKIFKTIYYVIIAAIAVVALFLIFSAVPIKGGYKTFVVLSGSMEPKIHTGSVVAIKPAKSYAVGDVITFGENTKTKSPTTHRIAEIKNENGVKIFVTKGDANNAPDLKTVTEKEILGKVLFSVPYVGYAVNTAQKPVGFLLIVIIPAVIIIYEEIQNIKREFIKLRKRRREKKEEKYDKNAEIETVKSDEKIRIKKII
jgi:signal peptidase